MGWRACAPSPTSPCASPARARGSRSVVRSRSRPTARRARTSPRACATRCWRRSMACTTRAPRPTPRPPFCRVPGSPAEAPAEAPALSDAPATRPAVPPLAEALALGLDAAPGPEAARLAVFLMHAFGGATAAIVHYGSHTHEGGGPEGSAFDFFVVVDRYPEAYRALAAAHAGRVRA